MPSITGELKELFGEIIAKRSEAERQSFLEARCCGKPTLRKELQSLLLAHTEANDFLQAELLTPSPVFEVPGTVIGRYKLLQQIGEGGFGIVFMTEQQEPVRRFVALKILKPGMDTREVLARFEAERQALALMDHPNIARVLDAGSTESGRPYFVMELVKGAPITDFCDQQKLSPTERLELFLQVCAGIQHAHQKGVIHRDLKPSNILVTLYDGCPVPKVIDFGVAKAVGQKLTERTLFTRFEQLVGTPAYMSPEQAEWSGLDVDTRSDVYALGVLLYELLTGTTPLDKDLLARAALDDVRRIIRETQPPAPSTRLLTLGARAEEIAAQRQSQPSLLSRLVRGDLDWIILKTLEKERNMRYETVNALASDIQRHLTREPIEARAPSRVYRASRFVRKHRYAVAASSGVVIALVCGLILALIGFSRARQTEKAAKVELDRAKTVEEFLRWAFLFQASPLRGTNPEVTIAELIDRNATNDLRSWFKDKAWTEAYLRTTFAMIYNERGELDKAEEQARRAHALNPLDPIKHTGTWVATKLAYVLNSRGKSDEAIPLLEQIVMIRRDADGPEHASTVSALADLACAVAQRDPIEGEALLRESWLKQEQFLSRNSAASSDAAEIRIGVCETAEQLARSLHAFGREFEARQIYEKLVQFAANIETVPEIRKLGINVELSDTLQFDDPARSIELNRSTIHSLTNRFPRNPSFAPELEYSTAVAYGNLADWQGSSREFQATIANMAGTMRTNWNVVVNGALAAFLAGKDKAYTDLVRNWFAAVSKNTNSAGAVGEIALLRPHTIADESSAADFVIVNVKPNSQYNYERETAAIGIAYYRKGNLQKAREMFEVPHRSPYLWLAAQAGYFTAMVHHRVGESSSAGNEMVFANERLKKFQQAGFADQIAGWPEFARALASRAEAEELIYGKGKETPIPTAEVLLPQWQKCKEVRNQLRRGFLLAQQSKWNEAATAYKTAIQNPAFDWETVMSTDSMLANAQFAAAFLMAGDSFGFSRLRTISIEWLRRYPQCAQAVAYTLLLNPGGEEGAKLLAEALPNVKETGRHLDLTRAWIALRLGRPEEALSHASEAIASKRPSIEYSARLVRAIALASLGKTNEGRTEIRHVQSVLSPRSTEFRPDVWWMFAITELLLSEAQQLVH